VSICPRILHSFAKCLGVLLLALVQTGCGMHLRETPEPATVSLQGDWTLSDPARDAVLTMVRQALEGAVSKQAKREAAHRPSPAMAGPPAPGGVPANTDPKNPAAGGPAGGMGRPSFMQRPQWEARDEREHIEALAQAVTPPEQLHIRQQPGRIEFTSTGNPSRRFEPGSYSQLVTTYADLRAEAGWQQGEFVVHSRDGEQNIIIVERYSRHRDNTLHAHITLSVPDAKRIEFDVTYKAA
jgi:hypothetical protein